MGVSSTTNRQIYSGNGTTTSFSFPYYFPATTDLLVFVYDTVAGGITAKTLGTDYSVTGTPNASGLYVNGGNVVFVTAPISTVEVVIVRSPPLQQNYALAQNGLISSSALVQQLDYLTLITQRLQDEVSRAAKLPDGLAAVFDATLPSDLALNPGSSVVVNQAGDGFELGSGAAAASVYADFASFPALATDGFLAIAADVDALYAFNLPTTSWKLLSSPSAVLAIGTIDSQTASANGAVANSNQIILQSASDTAPGLVNLQTQTFKGNKTIDGTIAANNLSGTNTGDQTAIPNSTLATMANNTVKGNVSGSTGTPTDLTATQLTALVSPMVGDSGAGGTKGSAPAPGSGDAAAGKYLKADGTWAVPPGGGSSPLTTKGDVYTHSTVDARLPVGADGTVLTADSTQATGLKWGSTLTNPMTTGGDIIYGGSSGTPTRLTNGTAGQALVSSGTTLAPVWTSAVSAPAASTFAGWDANKNLSATNHIEGYTTTATAAGTTTLTVGSNYQQFFTGTTTQTVALPVATTLVNGQQFMVTNNSTGTVTVQSSGGNTLQGMATNTVLLVTCINTAGGTGTASWNWVYTGSVNATAPTIQKFTSSSGTYTTPAGVQYIRVRMVGGGAGGGASVSSGGTSATSGGNSTFGSSLLVANGGTFSNYNGGGGGGNGGTASLGTGPIGTALQGAGGGGSAANVAGVANFTTGGAGGSNPLGGGGTMGASGAQGGAGAANTGAGGGGAGGPNTASVGSGPGGGAGGYIDAIISGSTLAATFAYAVGAGGVGETASGTGSAAGGAGGSGYIEVTEYYSNGLTAGFTSASFTAPTTQKFTSGSGTYTLPTSPRSPVYIRVRMVGAGGGGGGSGTSAGAGGTGGNTTFGTTLLVANGATPTAGGTASLGTGPVGVAIAGGNGQASDGGNTNVRGGTAASSAFGGAGPAGTAGNAGGAAVANSGSGGGGAGDSATISTGAGGGAGGFVDAIITSPSSTYAYAVGGAGTAGTAGTSGNAGGAGGAGIILVEEFYQ